MQQDGNSIPPGPQGPPPQANLTDSVESAGSGLRAKWASLEVPIQIGVVVGTVIVIAAFARFVLPAMLAAIGVGAVIAVLFIPYWLPTIVAFFRGHPNKAVIALVNFFFGWTFIGWFISLFWALTDPVVAGGQPVIVTVNNTANAGGATVSQNQPGPPNTPQQYRVGDVVNGHRFDGANWVPEGGTYQAPPPPPQ